MDYNSLVDQNGRPLFDSLQNIAKEELQQILGNESVKNSIRESAEKLRDEMLHHWKGGGSIFDTIVMGSSGMPIASQSSFSISDVKQKPSDSTSKISEEIGKAMTSQIPSKFADSLLQYLNAATAAFTIFAKGRDELLSNITEEKINDLLTNINVPFLSVQIRDVKVTTTGKNQLKFNFNFETKNIRPFIQISSEPPLFGNPLFKMTFLIDLKGAINNVAVTHSSEQESLLIDLGTVDANFVVAIKEIKIANKQVITSKEDEDTFSNKLLENNFTKKLPAFFVSTR